MFHFHKEKVNRKEKYLNTKNFIETGMKKNQPSLLIADYYGAPYKAYGLFYGMAWCGHKMGEKYAVELIKHYPNIYFYHGWNNQFNQWGTSFSFIDLLKRYNKVVHFVGDPEKENDLVSKLHGLNRQVDSKFEKIVAFPETRETVYEVTYDSTKGKNPFKLYFDGENLDSSKMLFINRESFKIGNGNTQSSELSKSGSNSIKLTKENPYGFTFYLSEVNKNDHYKISIYKYNNKNHNSGLVVAANDVTKYYKFITESSQTENHWQKIEFDFIVPDAAHLQDIKIYCWNNDSILSAYFDDLSIEKF
ncbi:MAG: hypothetical protein HC905_22535 [Bacteroidales bacterium]|nr:hypothetical protein [Bacteroidales bacterium]